LIPWVEEPVMVTPEVVGHIDPVCLVELKDEREARKIDSTIAPDGDFAVGRPS
jgi:hypothetical protein